MKGRGSRTIDPNEFQRVTPDATVKDRFVLVDAVGVVDSDRIDATPLEQHTERQISLEQLLRRTGTLEITLAEASTLASRLARLNQQITADERAELERIAGQPLTAVVRSLTRAADPDELARAEAAGPPGERDLAEQAVAPLAANPDLRARLLEIRRAYDITYDEVNPDTLISAAGVDPKALAQQTIDSWRAYLERHHDEIALIEAGYERGTGPRPVYAELKELATRIARPPHGWTPDGLWHAYEELEIAADRPGVRYGPLDLIGLIRYELGVEEHPRPHRAVIDERFAGWLARQRQAGREFIDDQMWWLERIRDIVANEAAFETSELDEPPFTERGGTDGFLAIFGPGQAEAVLTDLRSGLAA